MAGMSFADDASDAAGKQLADRIQSWSKDKTKSDWVGIGDCGLEGSLPAPHAESVLVRFSATTRFDCANQLVSKVIGSSSGPYQCHVATSDVCTDLKSLDKEARKTYENFFSQKAWVKPYVFLRDSKSNKVVFLPMNVPGDAEGWCANKARKFGGRCIQSEK
jgi:hypothetical protein